MRKSPFWWILMSFMLLIDIYFFQALLVVTHDIASAVIRIGIYSIYWAISVAAVAIFVTLPYIRNKYHARLSRTNIFSLPLGLFFAKFIASFFS